MANGRIVAVLAVAVVVQRLLELRVARRNEAWLCSMGAREFGAKHYRWFFVLHTGWLLGWCIESQLFPSSASASWVWAAVALLAQALRYWAIGTLGRRWNTKVLVVAGLQPIATGPYRFVSHPNYVAVVLELAAIPLVVGAWRTALLASAANAALLLAVRIPCERRALRWAARAKPAARAAP